MLCENFHFYREDSLADGLANLGAVSFEGSLNQFLIIRVTYMVFIFFDKSSLPCFNSFAEALIFKMKATLTKI